MKLAIITLSNFALSYAWQWNEGPFQNRLVGSSFGTPNQDATYDYAVIGGGTGGSAIAARLAEDGTASVALIEAGGFPWEDLGNQTEVPGYTWRFEAFANLSDTNPTVDWDLETAPQQNLGGRSIHYTAAKTFGGGSSLNDMGYHRVTKGTMNLWADLVGDDSYTWSKFLPFYKKSTTYTPIDSVPDESVNFDYHKPGPLQVSYPPHRQPTNPFLSRAFEKLGFGKMLGNNGGLLNGYAYWTYYQDPEAHTRSSAATAYLKQALKHNHGQGLHLYPRTQAQKIVIEGGKTRAVIAQTAGSNYTITASREIILSAGFIHSPQILMLSGIGPASTLRKQGIEVVVDLPGVGSNWQDQPYVFTLLETDAETDSAIITDPARLERARRQYIESRSGPLTSPGFDLVGWEKFPPSYRSRLSPQALALLDSFPSDWPDVEFIGAGLAAGNPADPTNNRLFALVAGLLVHDSVGNISLTSGDIRDPPVLNMNLLTTTTDRELAVAAVRRVLQLADSTGIVTNKLNPTDALIGSDIQLLEWINQNVVFGYHGSSTCKMGKPGDRSAVVDSKARVYGLDGLRVVDASVLPFCVPGHPSATIFALAEKIARDIRCSYQTCSVRGGGDHDEL
ncbi:hypothetical protein TruAng_004235 [Truncatella angustata]|nr:hypothetical protein TruAng_004235 [Truncatella angustata]